MKTIILLCALVIAGGAFGINPSAELAAQAAAQSTSTLAMM
jgi:hypothetical protein